MTFDLKGALADLLPLASDIWNWAAAHYLTVMGFALALAFVVAWGRRRKG
jgi:hypothetical protein